MSLPTEDVPSDVNGFRPGDRIVSTKCTLCCTVQEDGTYWVENGHWYGTPLPDNQFQIHTPEGAADTFIEVPDWRKRNVPTD